MKYLLAVAAAAAIAASTPVFAQEQTTVGFYGDLGYSYAGASNDDGDYSLITGRIGGRNQHLGVEAEASAGLNSHDFGGGVSGRIQDEYGVFVVGYLPVASNTELFGRVGYAHTDLHISFIGTQGLDGVAGGGGAQYFFNGGSNGVRGEYTYYDFNKGFGHADTGTISFVRKF
jgi:hypothetical protein